MKIIHLENVTYNETDGSCVLDIPLGYVKHNKNLLQESGFDVEETETSRTKLTLRDESAARFAAKALMYGTLTADQRKVFQRIDAKYPAERVMPFTSHGFSATGARVRIVSSSLYSALTHSKSDPGAALPRQVKNQNVPLWLQAFPKTELHLHLEAAFPGFEMIDKFAKRNGVDFPSHLQGPKGNIVWRSTNPKIDDFTSFLTVYDQVAAVLRTPEDIEELTYEYLQAQHKRGVVYQELTVAPILTPTIPYLDYMDAVSRAITRAQHECGIETRILLVIVRHELNKDNLNDTKWSKDVDQALQYQYPHPRFPYFVGIGLAGNEIDFPGELFREAFNEARACGLQCTAHVGEMTPPDRMQQDIKALGVTRIGHGINAIKDLEFLQTLVKQDVDFEVCLRSNMAFPGSGMKTVHDHPVKRMAEAGAKINLSSDDPLYFGPLDGDYWLAYEAGLNLYQITLNGIEANFAPKDVKLACKLKVEQWMKDHILLDNTGKLQAWWNAVHTKVEQLEQGPIDSERKEEGSSLEVEFYNN